MVYERGRKIWREAGELHRRDPYIRPTFGAHVESHQTLGARLVAFIRAVWRSLR
jgi:broad specificity phosphatase PhoE